MRLHRAANLLLSILIAATAAAEEKPADWKLVWQDEFEAATLDPAKWAPCERGTSDWDDTMSKDPRLIEIKDGLLKLHGMADDSRAKEHPAFITGGVTSKGKFEFHQGKIEIRARFKSAQGAWPAIWLLAAGVQWPAGGEIDIMEHLNFEDKIYQTIHTPYTIESKKKGVVDDNVRTSAIQKDEFNTYGMEWDAEAVTFSVNGKKSFTYKRDASKGAAQWPFDKPMYVILSMQIGGAWVGEVKAADYPAHIEVDWVRAYKWQVP